MSLRQIFGRIPLGRVTMIRKDRTSPPHYRIRITLGKTGILSELFIYTDPLDMACYWEIDQGKIEMSEAQSTIYSYMTDRGYNISFDEIQAFIMSRFHQASIPQEYITHLRRKNELVPNRVDAQYVADYFNKWICT